MCPIDEPAAEIDSKIFNDRYEKAVQVARSEFGEDMGERRRFQREAQWGASIDRKYVVEGLGEIAESIENPKQQRTLAQYQDIVETVSADQIISEFGNLREEGITGNELTEAVMEIISRYNLKERYEEHPSLANSSG